MFKRFEIWSEGFAATGQSGPATFHGYSWGKDFSDAVNRFADRNEKFARDYRVGELTYWGCRLFDNESDARRSFG